MSVLSGLRRYRLSIFLFSCFLLTVLLVIFLFSSRLASRGIDFNWQNLPQFPSTKLIQNVQKTVLANGLTVLTKEVHNAPVVSVQVWYKIGSRHEELGVNGIAHQLEHIMFKGTKNRPVQFARLFSALGSDSNAFTSYDQTVYHHTAERDKLKALLVLEADRMQNLRINSQQLASEKKVVISELEGYENSPEYRLSRAVMGAAFPNHPYGLPVGGTKAHVEQFTVEQVKNYYRKFYTSDNAVLVIVGDFSTASTLDIVKEVFGNITTKKSESKNLIRKQKSFSETPILLREPGATPLLQIIYPLPDVNHPDIPALNVMDYILTGGINSYLYPVLVESGLASEITAHVASARDGSWYDVLVKATPDQDLSKIDHVLQEAIANLAKTGVTSEQVERAKTQLTAALILSNRDITSLAMQLGYNETTAGDYRYIQRYLAKISQIKPADVNAVLQKYLQPQGRVVGFFQPTQIETKAASKSYTTQTKENFTSGKSVALVEVMKYLPNVESSQKSFKQEIPQLLTFNNGLRLLLLPNNTTPTVTLIGHIQAGTEFDPDHQAGLAALVAENLLNGTKTQDKLTLTKTLEARGINLDFTTYREGVRINANSLATDLPILLTTLADVIQNSTFPAQELEITRQQALTAVRSDLDNPEKVARRLFTQTVYPENHPLHNLATEKTIQKVQREDLINFKAQHYRPDTTVLALVGDLETEKVRSLVESLFGNWHVSGQAPKIKYSPVTLPSQVVRVNAELPGKAQTVTNMGFIGLNRQDSRFYAALVFNQILGGDTLSSRLGEQVRDRQGLTYGIYSNLQAGKNTGTLTIEMQTSPEDTNKAISSTIQILQRIQQQGVTPLEVETAQKTLISNYNLTLANPEEITDRILMNEVYGLGKLELRAFKQKIQQVTLNQVNQIARELLQPDKIVIVTAGSAVNN
ncbi:MAG TPA: pitrilysin family protein [Nostocaceae cyanobacterium]|nr:pitrilysin family protein [Nostocaceae cyanobacterium]